MKQNLKLNLSVYELPKNARELLYNGYSLDESDQHLGADIPPSWWKVMRLLPEMEKAIKKFWKKNPSGYIEWD